MCHRPGVLFGWLAAMLLIGSWGWGCSRFDPAGPGGSPDGKGEYGLGQALFRAAGLSGWYAEDDPDIGVGLEGLYPLVNGAAGFYWESGVRGAAFQNFVQAEGRGMLEIQHFVFLGPAEAGVFFEEQCRDEGGTATRGDTYAKCLFSFDPTDRALLWEERNVLDLRLYGNPGSDPVAELVRAFPRVGTLPVACKE